MSLLNSFFDSSLTHIHNACWPLPTPTLSHLPTPCLSSSFPTNLFLTFSLTRGHLCDGGLELCIWARQTQHGAHIWSQWFPLSQNLQIVQYRRVGPHSSSPFHFRFLTSLVWCSAGNHNCEFMITTVVWIWRMAFHTNFGSYIVSSPSSVMSLSWGDF